MLSIDQNSFCLQPQLGADWINDAKSSLPALEAVDGDGRSAFMMIGRAVLEAESLFCFVSFEKYTGKKEGQFLLAYIQILCSRFLVNLSLT